MKQVEHVFNYLNECMRLDAPADGIGDWLDHKAEAIVNQREGGDWVVKTGRLFPHGGTTLYKVTLEPRFQ